MKRLIFILTLLVTLVSLNIVSAQTQEIVPIPAGELFSSRVQVVDPRVEITPLLPRELEEREQIDIDEERQLVFVYNVAEDQWQSFNYPQGANEVYGAQRYSQQKILIATSTHRDNYWGIEEPYFDYFLDLSTGEYAIVERVCGEIVPANGEPLYAFQDDTRLQRTAVCHVNNGELIALLPSGVSGRRVVASPDEQWLFIVGYETATNSLHAYSYNLASQQLLLQMTERAGDNFINVYTWLAEDRAVFTLADAIDSTPVISSYYMIDLARENSADFAYSQVLYGGFPILDTHLAYMNRGVGSNSPEPFACTLTRFDDQTGFDRQTVGYDCPGWLWIEGNYYVVRIVNQSDTPRLSFVDGVTGEIRDIAIDAGLRAIVDASQGYVAVLMESNVAIPYIAIYNAANGEVVYRTGTAELNGAGLLDARSIAYMRFQAGFPSPIQWLDEHTALVTLQDQSWEMGYGEECCAVWRINPSLRLVRLNETDSDVQMVYFDQQVSALSISPDYRYIVANAGTVVLVDMQTESYEPLLTEADPHRPRPELNYEWLSNTSLEVSYAVGADGGCPSEHTCTIVYTLNLQTSE